MKIKLKSKVVGISLILFMAFSTGCYYDQVLPEQAPPPPDVDVSYANEIQTIWDARCVGCHGGSIAPNLTSPGSYNELINGYVNTADPSSSLIYTKIAPGGSMESNADPADAPIVLLWIEQGAKDN